MLMHIRLLLACALAAPLVSCGDSEPGVSAAPSTLVENGDPVRVLASREPASREDSTPYPSLEQAGIATAQDLLPIAFDPDNADASVDAAYDHAFNGVVAGGEIDAERAATLVYYLIEHPHEAVSGIAAFSIGRVLYDARVTPDAQVILRQALLSVLAGADNERAVSVTYALAYAELWRDQVFRDALAPLRSSMHEPLRARATVMLEDAERILAKESGGDG